MEHLFHYMSSTLNKIWEDKGKANKKQQILVKTQVFS